MHDRRTFLAYGAASLGLSAAGDVRAASITAPEPFNDKRVSAIGMGSWLTFDCANDAHALGIRVEVLREFFARGGTVIDSSPMYGSSEQALGYCLEALAFPQALFAASKVWTPGRWLGQRQMNNSRDLWRIDNFDLMQVHNLLDVDSHIETLREWKASGRLKYIGLTTSHGRRHAELEKWMQQDGIDFVQLTYNLLDRDVEQRLLPIALERGIAVIANRPLRGSRLFDRVRGRALPSFAKEIECTSWSAFFLKYAISHPAITCAIPATSKVDHMIENMEANHGLLPDAALRKRMLEYYVSL